jgi:hypothetical protein
MAEKQETIAELTVYYKKQRLSNLLFDTQETADKFVEVITHFLGEKGIKEISFKGEIKTVYMPENIIGEVDDYAKGKIKPKGTILEMMKVIDGLN